ncbi:MAG: hypothetical protein EYC62_04090 [Alphaproteobacteria bacterium]|nr:MAG: hypothetical protein EYC62_04090 [Alphaproteobacteria bacterium]
MSLSIKSNQASNIALRALNQSDRAMTASLSKLSSGSRVQSARDDAAALAIGSRLKAELSALKTVSNNATQGIAMLQIAEGAYARATDMVIRMRSLATQAASSNLSNTERGMLDTEFQAIKSEINRMAASTTFNNQQIVNSTVTLSYDPSYMPTTYTDYIADFTIYGITGIGSPGDWVMAGNNGTYNFVSNVTGKTYYVDYHTAIAAGIVSQNTTAVIYEADNITGLPTGVVAGSFTILQGADDGGVFVALDEAFNNTSAGMLAQSFKVSTGSTNNSITTNIFGISAANLGLSQARINTANDANNAALAAKVAIDLIAKARSEVAAAQNRMESSQQNNASTTENLELARSAYLDLDVASEMSSFTSKQVLIQAGISMLAQANQVPKNLLKLFQ